MAQCRVCQAAENRWPRPGGPAQLSWPPRVLVFWKMLCIAEMRSLSWMLRTWNYRQGCRGEGLRGPRSPRSALRAKSTARNDWPSLGHAGPSCPGYLPGWASQKQSGPGLCSFLSPVSHTVPWRGPAQRRPHGVLLEACLWRPPHPHPTLPTQVC